MEREKTPAAITVAIRGCRQEDLVTVAEILAAAPGAANWSSGGLQDALRLYASHFLVAELDSQIAGFAFGRSLGDEAEVLNIAVRLRYQRQGIGRALLEQLLASFRAAGISTFFLEVRESNTAATRLYDQFGFLRTGRRPDYYRDPVEAALVYRAELPRNPQTEGRKPGVP